MTQILREPILGPSAWCGAQFPQTDDWVYRLEPHHVEELDRALRQAENSSLRLFDISAEDFPPPSLSQFTHRLRNDLEGGRGFGLIRGLPIERYSEEQMAVLFWGLGTHLGIAEPQDRAGHLLHHVRDTGQDLATTHNIRKYQTNEQIPFHNDGSDVFMLLCLRNAKKGGRSQLVSAVSVFNEILRRSPALAGVLQQPFYFDARDQQQEGMPPYQVLPIYSYHAGFLNVLYKRFYIELAQRFPGVPRLTEEQVEALDLMDAICADPKFCLEFDMHPGDIQVANNYAILHSRTLYEDYEEPERKRHMLRLWLSIPNGRPLPPVFETTREFRHSYARRKPTGPRQHPVLP